jgi:hypothetical protein
MIPNYPDLLGAITGGERCALDNLHLAAATRPRVARAGRPFEVILLVQNVTDADVDVTMTLHLPQTDLKKQRDRFISKVQRLLVGIKPAEVGYVMLPVSTLIDVAPGEYTIGVEFSARTIGRSGRIRQPDGGGVVRMDDLSARAAREFESLRELSFFTSRRRLSSTIELPLMIMSGTVGKVTDFAPGWVSLLRLSEYGDARPMLHEYADRLLAETLPQLKRALMYAPLLDATHTRFEDAGFPLRDAEAVVIAKLLTLILEYANPRQTAHGHIAARQFNIHAMLERDPLGLEAPPHLPHWFRRFMRYAEDSPQVFAKPAQMILGYLYEDLIGDAVDYAFALVEEASGENLGTADEMVRYRERVQAALRDKQGMDFSLAYLPLIIGGAIRSEQLPLEGEHPADVIKAIGKALEDRIFDSRDDERPVFDLANQILARIGQRHGYQPTHD